MTEEAVRLFQSHADFAKAQVRMRDRMQAAEKEAPADARCFGTRARLEYALERFDIRAETFLELVSDIPTQNAFVTFVYYFERVVYEEYAGYPIEILPGHPDYETIQAKVERWIYEGYKRLESLSQTQPECTGEPASNAEKLSPSGPGTEPNYADNGSSGRRAAVDAYIEEVFSRTKKRITRKDIWQKARYKSRTEFERWERNDPKLTNRSAHDRFTRILSEKPHLK